LAEKANLGERGSKEQKSPSRGQGNVTTWNGGAFLQKERAELEGDGSVNSSKKKNNKKKNGSRNNWELSLRVFFVQAREDQRSKFRRPKDIWFNSLGKTEPDMSCLFGERQCF